MTDAYAPEMAPEYGMEPGGAVVQLGDYRPAPTLPPALTALIESQNIAEDLDDSDLAAIGSKVCEEYEIDLQSRETEGWTTRNEAALKLAMQVKEAKTYPWPNAANIKYPLIATAAIQFNARAYPAIVDGANVVKGKVLGKPSEEKRARADRIGRHMSYQLLEEMDGWEEDTDRLLVMLPITGTVFRKSWFDPAKGKNASEIITADKLVVNYWAKPLDACPRVTQLCEYYPHEIEERIRAGVWRNIDLGPASGDSNDDDARHEFLEQHRLWDLDADGYPEPYIVTVHRETQRVVRIVARFDEEGVYLNGGEVECIKPVQYFTKYGFIPSMDGSFYDIGFGALLDALNETINSTMNQLMDAGHLANVQGGFIGTTGLKGGALSFKPGEWKRVETSGPDLRAAIVPLPVKEPSGVLFNLLGLLIDSARDITSTKDILTGETQGQNQPVGTTLATIEQGLKVFTAIYKRVHRSLKQEFRALARLNKLYLQDQEYFSFQDEEGVVAREDYEDESCDVIPVSDPTVVTDMQRVARAQFVGQFIPLPFMNAPAIVKRQLEAAGISDSKELFAEQAAPDPKMMVEQAKMELEQGKMALDADRLEIERQKQTTADAQADANIQATVATTIKTLIEAGLLQPQFQLQSAQMVMNAAETADQVALKADAQDQKARQAAVDAEMKAQGPPGAQDAAAGQVQPGDPGGMEGPPPDAMLPPLPEGPPAGVGEPMGAGRDAFGGAADQGPALRGPGGT